MMFRPVEEPERCIAGIAALDTLSRTGEGRLAAASGVRDRPSTSGAQRNRLVSSGGVCPSPLPLSHSGEGSVILGRSAEGAEGRGSRTMRRCSWVPFPALRAAGDDTCIIVPATFRPEV
jgi:hypothetical protein